MYTIMNASPLTLVIIMASIMVTPLYMCATYVASSWPDSVPRAIHTDCCHDRLVG